MKKQHYIPIVVVACLSAGSLFGQARFETDRLGYSGTAVKYASMSDLTAAANDLDTVTFSNRDAGLYFGEGAYAYAVGTWWYTTDPAGRAGWGNTTGNTGPGYMQLYDGDGSTVDSFSMLFDNFDGTYWRDAILSVSGTNAIYPDEFARFSLPANTGDVGVFHSYEIDIVVSGLEGIETAGWVEATNHPTSVTGTMRAIFENTSTSQPANNGFFDIELTFNMDNWAYANRDLLTGDYMFEDSYFAAAPVPEPATIGLLSVALMGGLLYLRRKRVKR